MNAAEFGSARGLTASTEALAQLLHRTVVEVRAGASGGAGIIWGGSGLVVTNAHCAPSGGRVEVEADGTLHEARVVARHRSHDLALLAAPSVRGPLLELRAVESLRPGELVFAYGHPLGVRDALTIGVLHGVARNARGTEPRWVVADVRLAPGNSGGPLVDAEGRLVGINSMIVNGLACAVPATLVKRFVEHVVARRAA
ncbi:MAG: S1C family serine protease [Gemmatimonadales bacterium]